LLEYFLSIYRSPLGAGTKLRCYFTLLPWIKWNSIGMVKDLLIAADQVLYNLQVTKTVSTNFPARGS
jgi:hypothetical protein